MGRVFKQRTTQYHTPDGRRCRADTPGAVKTVTASQFYWGEWKGEGGRKVRENLQTRDKGNARLLVSAREVEAARVAAGLDLPGLRKARETPLADHLSAWEAAMKADGTTAKQAGQAAGRVRRVLEAAGFRTVADLDQERAQAVLAGWQGTEPRFSAQTRNHYRAALRAFGKWLTGAPRNLPRNPFAGLDPVNVRAAGLAHERRAPDPGEVPYLLAAARRGGVCCGLSGADREALYRVALGTGFRASELASMSPASFDLKAGTATVAAGYTKNGEAATLPLPVDLREFLTGWLAGKPVRSPCWPGKWALHNRGGEMVQADLAAARAAWLTEAGSGRADPDFLAYRDQDGRFLDFHSLRAGYITALVQSGASVKVAQTLARHSTPTLTLGAYAKVRPHDLQAAVDNLPGLQGGREDNPSEVAALLPTGTMGPVPVYPMFTLTGGKQGQSAADGGNHQEGAPGAGGRDANPSHDNSSQPLASAGKRRGRDLNPRGDRSPVGFQDRQASVVSTSDSSTSDQPSQPVYPLFTADELSDHILAKLVERWPHLPAAIRAGIRALMEAADE